MLAGNEIATYRLLHKVPILVFLHLHHLSFRLPRRLPHLCVCVCVCVRVCVRACARAGTQMRTNEAALCLGERACACARMLARADTTQDLSVSVSVLDACL